MFIGVSGVICDWASFSDSDILFFSIGFSTNDWFTALCFSNLVSGNPPFPMHTVCLIKKDLMVPAFSLYLHSWSYTRDARIGFVGEVGGRSVREAR